MKKYIFILLFFSSTFGYRASDKAIVSDSIQQVLKEWKEKDSLTQWLNTQKQLSQSYRSQNNLTKSLSILNDAIENCWRDATTEEEQTKLAWIYVNRAYLFEVDGFFLEAQTDYTKADHLFLKLKTESYNISRFVWHPLGNIYTRLGENELAAYFIKKSLKKYDELDASSDLVDAHNDLGIIYINQGKFKQAIEVLEEGIGLEIDDPLSNALLYSNIADAQYCLNRNNKGIVSINSTLYYLDQAAKLYSESHYYTDLVNKYLMNSLTIKGMLLTRLNQTVNAEKEFKKSLSYQKLFKNGKHRQIARTYLGLAQNSYLLEKPLKALSYYQKSFTSSLVEFNDSSIFSNPTAQELYAEVMLGEALLGKAEAAKSQYSRDSNLKWLLLAKECYQLYFSWEKRIRSEYYHESSKLSFAEELHQATESALELFMILQEIQPKANWAKEAFLCMEQSKGVLLSESNVNLFQQIPELRNDSTFFQLQLSRKQYQLITEHSLDNSERREELQEKILFFENDLRKRFPYYHSVKSNANNMLSPALLLKYLELQNADLVSYFIGSKSGFSILIRNKQFALHSFNKDQYNQVLEPFIESLANSTQLATIYENASLPLYQLLFPFDTIHQKERLIIVPDERLNKIPFETLVDNKNKETVSFKNLSYLMLHKTISYSPSAKFLLRTSQLQAPTKSFLGIAPDFKNSTNAFLSYSAKEVASGKAIFGGDLLVSDSIQKEALISKLSDYQIIHWVSHAGLDSSILDGAWIAINPKDKNDAKLFPPELLTAQLSTPLLTLNACETAAGRYQAGEGIYSLSRGFSNAGAQNIVTNLWQANHVVNNQLMDEFYTRLNQGENISSALTKAKRKYLQLESTDEFGAHPHFWAAPILIGNNKTFNFMHQSHSNSSILYTLLGLISLLIVGFLLMRKFK